MTDITVYYRMDMTTIIHCSWCFHTMFHYTFIGYVDDGYQAYGYLCDGCVEKRGILQYVQCYHDTVVGSRVVEYYSSGYLPFNAGFELTKL